MSLSKDDPHNPVNFSRARKYYIVSAGIYFVFNSALGSSLPSGAMDVIAADLGVNNDTQLVLLNSLYMVGFALGPLIFGPMSEHVGRRPVLISTYLSYVIFTMACAVAPNYTALLIFRLLCGVAAATPNAVLGGLYADIFDEPRQRGMAMSIFMYVTTLAPPLSPTISGFASLSSWRLVFWISFGIAASGVPLMVMLPETYAPVLCRQREHRERKYNKRAGSLGGLHTSGGSHIKSEELWVIFARPMIMLVREPIVLFTSLYLALVYSILYLYFQAYPIVFKGIYGMSNGVAGLAFFPIVGGSTIALLAFFWYSSYHERAMLADSPWAKAEEYRRLPLACGGAPAIVIALFWLGWSSKESIHPVVPMLSGLWFGVGYLLIFIAMINYLTDAYRQFSASANAAAGTVRSISAVCLPLATTPMYKSLGVAWASSLLGFISLLMAGIPFVFVIYGHSIRSRSPFCQKVMEMAKSTDSSRTMEEDGEVMAEVVLQIPEKQRDTVPTTISV
ncbi:Fc.00g068440.m01.CDS01 [Cosmosporella sp. VM-42]